MEPRGKIDLDAVRAARLEEIGAGPTVRFGGQDFTLAPELDLEVAFQLAEASRCRRAARALEGDDPETKVLRIDYQGEAADHSMGAVRAILGQHFDAFRAQHPSNNDVSALIEAVLVEYGTDQGEPQASEEPSSDTGEPARPTSAPTTD